jgi:hypothetical protein
MTQINESYNWVIDYFNDIKRLNFSENDASNINSDNQIFLQEKRELKNALEDFLQKTKELDFDINLKNEVVAKIKGFLILLEKVRNLEELNQLKQNILEYFVKTEDLFDDDDEDDSNFDSVKNKSDLSKDSKPDTTKKVIFFFFIGIHCLVIYEIFAGARALVRAIGNMGIFEPEYELMLEGNGGYFLDENDEHIYDYTKRYKEAKIIILPDTLYCKTTSFTDGELIMIV